MSNIFLKFNAWSTTWPEKEFLFLINLVDICYVKTKSEKHGKNQRKSKQKKQKATACFPFLQLVSINIQWKDGFRVKQHGLKRKV